MIRVVLVALIASSSIAAQQGLIVVDQGQAGTLQALEVVEEGGPGGVVGIAVDAPEGAHVAYIFGTEPGRNIVQGQTLYLGLEGVLPTFPEVTAGPDGAVFSVGIAAGQIPFSFRVQACIVGEDGVARVTNTATVFGLNAALQVNPGAVVANEPGSAVPLSAALCGNGLESSLDLSAVGLVSSDESVARVVPDSIEFVGLGSALIDASFEGLTDSVSVVVDPAVPASVEVAMGAQGGVLVHPSGAFLDVPPEALATPITLRIETAMLPDGVMVPSEAQVLPETAHDFLPDGLVFDRPVSVGLAFDPSSVSSDLDPESAIPYFLDESLNELVLDSSVASTSESGTVEVDADAGLTRIRTNHFTCWAAVIRSVRGTAPVVLPSPDGVGSGLELTQFLKTEVRTDSGVVPPPIKTVPNSRIVLHSTSGPRNQSVSAAVAVGVDRSAPAWAHYYIGRQGRIFQVSEDNVRASHVAAAGFNANSIGIELVNFGGYDASATDGIPPLGEEPYSGAQLSALVRLCEYLLRANPMIERPSFSGPDGGTLDPGGFVSHGEVQENRSDPVGDFRRADDCTDCMGLSLEFVLYSALARDLRGFLATKGGDALGEGAAGAGGDVEFIAGERAMDNPVPSRPSIIIPRGETRLISSFETSEFFHMRVAGTLIVDGDASLDLDGVFYVAPDGLVDARGFNPGERTWDGVSGFDLTVGSDGFCLIDGRVLMNGADKIGSEVGAFTMAPYPEVGSGSGSGGSGGRFVSTVSAPGPIFVPTVVTRGGDADSAGSDGVASAGGDGGSVTISADSAQAVDVYFTGFEVDEERLLEQPQVAYDTLPQPGPFNLMPVISDTPFRSSGACPVTFRSTSDYVRPLVFERLAIGREIFEPDHSVVFDPIGRFRRGILTSGGLGAAALTGQVGGIGGNGGSIGLFNESPGATFFADAQLVTGAGPEDLASVIFVAGGGCGDFKLFYLPNGGCGGRGGLNGGAGGAGGAAGSVVISGAGAFATASGRFSSLTPGASFPILGFDLSNPNFVSGVEIGRFQTYLQEVSIGAVGGTGGSPGGASSGFPGLFGARGADGLVLVP